MNSDYTYYFHLQDCEEQLDQKDRLIKKLQNQIKSLESSQRGNVRAVALLCEMSNKSQLSLLTASLCLTQPSKHIRLLFPKIILACWNTRERTSPGSFKISSWVFFTDTVTWDLFVSQLHSGMSRVNNDLSEFLCPQT